MGNAPQPAPTPSPASSLGNPQDVRAPNFLLHTEKAAALYARVYADPAIDYHTHISPKAMAEDLRFENITQLLLGKPGSQSPVFDHYFARLLRERGHQEDVVSGQGDISDERRFLAICRDFYKLAGNPTYHWVRRTLQEFFDIHEMPSTENALDLWQRANTKLQEDGFSIRGLVKQRNIQVVCTTDDPTDSLEYHAAYNQSADAAITMLPTWRPDKILAIVDDRRNQFLPWLEKLRSSSDLEVTDFKNFLRAIDSRHAFFHERGCRVADIGLANFVYEETSEKEVAGIFQKRLQGDSLTEAEVRKYQSFMLLHLAALNAQKGWVQQFHQGPMRDANGELFKSCGADTGGDYVGDPTDMRSLQRFLDTLNSRAALAKTILYPLDSNSYKKALSLLGSFQSGGPEGRRLHLGVPWWFNDTEEDIRAWIRLNASHRRSPPTLACSATLAVLCPPAYVLTTSVASSAMNS